MARARGVLEDQEPQVVAERAVAARPAGVPRSPAEDIAKLRGAELRDIESQLVWRPRLLTVAGAFLFLQTLAVFWITGYALFGGKVQNVVMLQPVLAVLVAGTLAQTYGIVRIMVEFIFGGVNYDAKETRMRKHGVIDLGEASR